MISHTMIVVPLPVIHRIRPVILTVICALIQTGPVLGQVAPTEGLHENTPKVFALTHATIIAEPGETIKNGTVLVRDGLIEDVGRRVKIPSDATLIPLDGMTIYAGFIDLYWETAASGDKKNDQRNAEKSKRPSSVTEHWNDRMNASRPALSGFSPFEEDLSVFRGLGFTTAQISAPAGVFRGQTAVVHLGAWSPESVILNTVAQTVAFEYGGWGDDRYPNSLLGAIALIRQTFLDAQWYPKAWGVYHRYPQFNAAPEVDEDLEALAGSLGENRPILFIADNELAGLRAGSIAREFGLPLWILGSGYEYRRLDAVRSLDPFLIVPVNFPETPKVSTIEEELQVSLADLRHWDQAPDNPRRLAEGKIPFALTTARLEDKRNFKKYVARSVERGWDAHGALAALTTIPAGRLGLGETHGKVAKGFVADLVVTEGDYFTKDSKVTSIWIAGEEFTIEDDPEEDFRGKWMLSLPIFPDGARSFTLSVEGKPDKLTANLSDDEISIPLKKLKLSNSHVTWSLEGDSLDGSGVWRFSGYLFGDQAEGTGLHEDGRLFTWVAQRTLHPESPEGEADDSQPETPEEASTLEPRYPEGAFGRTGPPDQPDYVVVRNATIWTSGPEGILENSDLLIEKGRIKALGPNLEVPGKRKSVIVEINGSGRYVTPGLIDAHSHSAAASINEGSQSVTAEVRMRDVLDSDDIAIYRELAGGLTMANVLHGSANAIGGQNAVIKLRWGATPEELLEPRAPQGIKFALGENVKQSNWGDKYTTRYPQTRMGVDQIIRDAFRAAQDYKLAREDYEQSQANRSTRVPPRKDLEMEALVEILDGDRLVHSHSYRQDEILNLIRIAEDFDFTIGTFQHVLEGYKVAPEIARHGAGASTFSDWWVYKFEVYDAIPFNGTLMTQAGVVASFNSDSNELARRLNTEAAKAVKYGDLSQKEALNLVTINPARQLQIDEFVGSLEPGKDADFVIWNGPPLATTARCDQTWIDGRKYFDREDDLELRKVQQAERARLIQKVLKSEPGNGEPGGHNKSGVNGWEGIQRDGCLWDIEIVEVQP